MPKSERQKLKLLYLRDLLEHESDEDHPLKASAIIDALERQEIRAERKSIYDDIRCLQDYGMDIVTSRGRGGGYYLTSREFELSELQMLADAVQSSQVLTQKKSDELVRKISSLASSFEAGRLQRQVLVSGRVKSMNENIFRNIDWISAAISQNRQISFRYFNWGPDHKKQYREKPYLASPISLLWNNENYYLIAFSENHGITHYRVDKMERITMTDIPRAPEAVNRKPDLSNYGKNVFGMFGGTPEKVRLRFENRMAGVILDRFGKDIIMVPDGLEHFTFTADVVVSEQFYGWLVGLGPTGTILFPERVREEFRSFCRNILAQYEP